MAWVSNHTHIFQLTLLILIMKVKHGRDTCIHVPRVEQQSVKHHLILTSTASWLNPSRFLLSHNTTRHPSVLIFQRLSGPILHARSTLLLSDVLTRSKASPVVVVTWNSQHIYGSHLIRKFADWDGFLFFDVYVLCRRTQATTDFLALP